MGTARQAISQISCQSSLLTFLSTHHFQNQAPFPWPDLAPPPITHSSAPSATHLHHTSLSGCLSKPYRGRHSDHSEISDSWVISSSYQEKVRLRQGSAEVGRKNPSGPRKRANSASDKVKEVTVTKVDKFEVEQ